MQDLPSMQSAVGRAVDRLAGGSWMILLVVCPVLCWGLLLYTLVFSRFYWLALFYLAWMWVDRHTPFTGGRRVNWFRKLSWWRKAAQYFPIQFVKTAELPPGRNYLLATFPHGVLCHGGFLALCTEAVDVSEQFTGLTITPFTLDLNFYMPLVRDVLMALGFCSVSSDSLRHFLKDDQGSHALCLVVGGASEALCSDPGTYLLVANRRKGFIKLALKNGTHLVPVLVLGETDLYEQVRSPWLRRLQEKVKSWTSVAPVLMNGAGIFQDRFGLLPRQKPLTVLVGSPIAVEAVEDPSVDQVDRLHSQFVKKLVQLFEEHKHKYIQDADNVRITFT